MTVPAMPGNERLLRMLLATAMVGGPLGYLLGGLLAPASRVWIVRGSCAGKGAGRSP